MIVNMAKLKTYGKGDRLEVQAQQIWLILTARAMLCPPTGCDLRKSLLYYGDLAEAMGKDRKARMVLGRQLGIVGVYCIDHDLPPLNVIVVNQETGQPGSEVVISPGSSVQQDQRRVFRQDWFGIRPPSIKALKDVYYSNNFRRWYSR